MAQGPKDLGALQDDIAALQSYDDVYQQLHTLGNALSCSWVIGCGALVFFMQSGFALVEAGTCRTKHCVSILAKNQVDFLASSLGWFLIGWDLAFGDSEPTAGLVGTTDFAGASIFDGNSVSDDALSFYFQQMFCAVAATIVSGGIAERATLKGYILFSFIMSSFIYPVVVCWCWNPQGWLASRGFSDFAGSGVVHLTGGMGALVGSWILGPRAGRFGSVAMHDSHEFNPHNVPFIALGTTILQFGWYGFNAGSTLAMQSEVEAKTAALTCVNTTIAAASAAAAATMVRLALHRRWDVPHVCNGILAGCVSITAGCASVGPWSAMLIGTIGGVILCLASKALEHLHIDDPVGAFPVHGACGVWGVLAQAFFHTGFDALGSPSPGPSLSVQLQGVGAIILFSGIMCFCMFRMMRFCGALEHSITDQQRGLDRGFTQGAYGTGEVTEFLAFISHAKGSHGACARWLQLELAAYTRGKSRIFLDSDNLVNLNHLLSTVRHKVDCMVVLASEDIWWRPWCAGEITVATQCNVPIVLVMMGEGEKALNLDFTRIANKLREQFPRDAMEILEPFGLSYEDIEKAYGKLSVCPQVHFGVFSHKETRHAIKSIATLAGLRPQSRGVLALNSIKRRAKGAVCWDKRTQKSLTEKWENPKTRPSCIVLCDAGDIEAVAASHICEKALVQAAEIDSAKLKVATCAGVTEAKVLQLVSAGATMIIILSKNALSCSLIQRACLVRAAALWPDGLVGAEAEGEAGLPVAVDPELGFQFPTPAFYEHLAEEHPHLSRDHDVGRLLSSLSRVVRRAVPFSWDRIELPYEDDSRAAMALVGFMKLMLQQIASPLSTHRSWRAIAQQTYWIYEKTRSNCAPVVRMNSEVSSRKSRRESTKDSCVEHTIDWRMDIEVEVP